MGEIRQIWDGARPRRVAGFSPVIGMTPFARSYGVHSTAVESDLRIEKLVAVGHRPLGERQCGRHEGEPE
jgi:hypothetical protein